MSRLPAIYLDAKARNVTPFCESSLEEFIKAAQAAGERLPERAEWEVSGASWERS